MKGLRLLTLAVCTTVRVFAAYQYDFPSLLNPYSASQWTANGVYSASNNMFTSSDTAGGSLIFNGTVSGDSTMYEVRMTLTLTTSGGYYLSMLRSTSNGLVTNGNTGTWYAVEIANPTFSGGACSATLYVLKGVGGTISWPYSTTVPCHNGMVVRSVMTPGLIMIYLDNGWGGGVWDSSITTGQPGIDVAQAPAGNGISAVDIGHRDSVPPNAVNAQLIGTSSFSNRVDLQWPGVVDDTIGSGFRQYYIYRDGSWLAGLLNPTFSDDTVTPGNHTYTISALDYHFNAANTTINVNVPAAGAIDPRQIGVRPLGTYWGSGGEQIDMRSGNLNYSVPLLKAVGRGGWGVNFNLTYNSQNWRQDSGGTWQFGRDVGYGHGWKLLAGSLIPVYSTTWVLHHYIFTDSTGAEYRLDQNNNGVWSSKESIYVYYDSNAGRLYFRDGSFWVLGCTSAGSEQDAGTMYPTIMEDTNGNQITVGYNSGGGVTWANSSARISTIRDVRPSYYPTYTFTFNNDSPPHLTGITNGISTSEAYSFSYTSTTIISPFDHATPFGTFSFLQTEVATGILLTTSFSYDTSASGELTKVTTPYGGYIRWSYGPTTYVGTRTQREVQNRYLVKSAGAAETTYWITRPDDSGRSFHYWGILHDPDGLGQKYWVFQTDSAQASLGLLIQYMGFPGNGNPAHLENYTWAADTVGNQYINTSITTEDYSGSYQVQKKVTRTLDQYGNLTQMQMFDYGSYGGPPQTTPARTYTNTYLSSSNYTSRYIFNRLATSNVTDSAGKSATLASMLYDGGVSDQPNMPMHDAAYGTSFAYRGNPYSVQRPGSSTSISYDIGGNVTYSTTNGVQTTATSTAANAYAVPSQLTTTSLTTNLSWSSFLGLSAQTGPNGDSASISYDSNARPSSSYSPYGAQTTYAYNDTGTPPTKTATTNGHWVRTTFDGFGRAIKAETGDGTSTKSVVDTVYDSCGCSPIGKMKQVSQPHLPGATPVYTTYNYDGLGRTTSVVAADGSTTNYFYAGNTVTVTDPAGKWKKFTKDAFGNLTRVDEASFTIATFYTYDVLNHLTQVAMWTSAGVQYRTFSYTTGNTVGANLLSATNPENGTITYTYNTDNTLATKTDAKGQQFTYTYDGYKRPLTVNVGGSILRTYYYDTNPFASGFSQYASGRPTAIQYANFSVPITADDFGGTSASNTLIDMYSYTQAGAIVTKRLRLVRTPPGSSTTTTDLDLAYAYNNEGKVTNITYPATTVGIPAASYNYSYDSMMRPSGMTDANNQPVVSNLQYGAANELLQITINGATETRQYNSLYQMTSINGLGQNMTYAFPVGANNGKISSQTDVLSGETVSYQYDSLNRLISASSAGWSQGYTYDGFGNLTARTGTNAISTPADPATNRLTGYSYDANGNLLSTGYSYDAENRLVQANAGGIRYNYDAQNKRNWAATFHLQNYSCGDFCSGSGWVVDSEVLYLFGIDGKMLASYPVQGAYAETRTYFGSRLIMRQSAGSGPQNLLPSGPDRVNSNGKFYPYGEQKVAPTYPQIAMFATYTRDATNLDYADQRYYSSQFGRFMTPDPYKAGSGGNDLDDPKSWNRYAYVLNDPVNYGDPTGQFGVKPCGGLDPYCQSDGLIFPPIGYPTGSRYAPADPLPPFDRWDQLSPDCQQGLETAMKGPDNAGNTRIRLAALDRAQKAQSVLQSAVAGTNIDWTVLAAIGIRESKFSPGSLSGNGMYGAFQINPSANGLTLDQAQNLSLAQQANIAVQNLTLFASRFSAISAEYGIDPILPAIANYDGVAPSKIINALLSGNPAALDQLTDRHNYISNVLDLTNCFK